MNYRGFVNLSLKKKLKAFLLTNVLKGSSTVTGVRVFKPKVKGTYALCLSAGPDSTLLLNAAGLYAPSVRLALLYFNHRKRLVDSDKEQCYVFLLAKAFNFQFYASRVPDSAMFLKPTQNYLRLIRGRFFRKVVGLRSIKSLFTAHHMDDNLEGIFMGLNLNKPNMLRGLVVATEGSRFKLSRPLFWVFKEEITYLLNKFGVRFFKDLSNFSLVYTRNFIRFKVIPLWKQSFGGEINVGPLIKKSFAGGLVDQGRANIFRLAVVKCSYSSLKKLV